MVRKRRPWFTVAPLLGLLKAWAGRIIGGTSKEATEVPAGMNGDAHPR